MAAATAAGGALAASGFPRIVGALADKGNPAPRPIPGGFGPLHFYPPDGQNEPNTITDFDGLIAFAHLNGMGTGTDSDGTRQQLSFDADMRFMSGRYVAVDGKTRKGAFGFV